MPGRHSSLRHHNLRTLTPSGSTKWNACHTVWPVRCCQHGRPIIHGKPNHCVPWALVLGCLAPVKSHPVWLCISTEVQSWSVSSRPECRIQAIRSLQDQSRQCSPPALGPTVALCSQINGPITLDQNQVPVPAMGQVMQPWLRFPICVGYPLPASIVCWYCKYLSGWWFQTFFQKYMG